METGHVNGAPPPSRSIKAPRPRLRRFFRFSLRGLLILVLMLSAWLGWQVNRAHKQRRAIARIHELGGRVEFDYRLKYEPNGIYYDIDSDAMPPGPVWFRNLVGDEYFRDVVYVDLTDSLVKNADMSVLADLPAAKHLYLNKSQIDDEGLKEIGDLVPQLTELDLSDTHITDVSLAHISKLRHLNRLVLCDTHIGDRGAQHLARLTTLRCLLLDGTRITDRTLAYIEDLPDLDAWLGLRGTKVTDEGLVHLRHLTGIPYINLYETQVTPKGKEWLSRQLPTCDVLYDGGMTD